MDTALYQTKTSQATSTVYSSEQLSEQELRCYVDRFFECFSSEYLAASQRVKELRLTDNRWYSSANNRYIDEVQKSVSSNGSVVLTEFKKGLLTKVILNECIYVRGYLELSFNQVPGFTSFVFVGESVDSAARDLCKKISNNEHGIKIVSANYQEYLKQMFAKYIKWSIARSIPKALIWKQAVLCHQQTPFWLGEDWLISLEKVIYSS